MRYRKEEPHTKMWGKRRTLALPLSHSRHQVTPHLLEPLPFPSRVVAVPSAPHSTAAAGGRSAAAVATPPARRRNANAARPSRAGGLRAERSERPLRWRRAPWPWAKQVRSLQLLQLPAPAARGQPRTAPPQSGRPPARGGGSDARAAWRPRSPSGPRQCSP